MNPDDLRRVKYEFLTTQQAKIYKLFLKGHKVADIAKELGMIPSNTYASLRIAIDKVCQYQYNIFKYQEILKMKKLSYRESKVLRLWKVRGRGNAYICKALGIKLGTLRRYKELIRSKVNVNELDAAVRQYSVFDNPDFVPADIGVALLKKQASPKNKDS
jgi:DNA-binding NarL/FixJ family response regulator